MPSLSSAYGREACLQEKLHYNHCLNSAHAKFKLGLWKGALALRNANLVPHSMCGGAGSGDTTSRAEVFLPQKPDKSALPRLKPAWRLERPMHSAPRPAVPLPNVMPLHLKRDDARRLRAALAVKPPHAELLNWRNAELEKCRIGEMLRLRGCGMLDEATRRLAPPLAASLEPRFLRATRAAASLRRRECARAQAQPAREAVSVCVLARRGAPCSSTLRAFA